MSGTSAGCFFITAICRTVSACDSAAALWRALGPTGAEQCRPSSPPCAEATPIA
ncbi:hypothetical protein PR001_g24849 [Phytophthora rubi]|uniref:Uncharacterized protein n=1 Tax=Phytophthora rubi TaxID=129364 RepID=A0A6A3I8C6_9STRA|nr:hypothetical protein PR001_g24849 [Phytophthora rubi]